MIIIYIYIQGFAKNDEDGDSKDSGWPSEHSPVDEFAFPAPMVSDDTKQVENDDVPLSEIKQDNATMIKRKRKSLVGVPKDLKRQRILMSPVQQQQRLTEEAPTPTLVRKEVVSKKSEVIKQSEVTFQRKKSSSAVVEAKKAKKTASKATAAPPASHQVRTSRRKAAIAASNQMKKNKNDWCSDDDDDDGDGIEEEEEEEEVTGVVRKISTTTTAKLMMPPRQTPSPAKQLEQENQANAPTPSTITTKLSSEKGSRKKRLQAVIDAHRNSLAQSLISPEPGNTTNHSRMVKQQVTPEQAAPEQKTPPLTLGDLHDLSRYESSMFFLHSHVNF